MTKRLKNKYKIIKFYNKDLWAKLTSNMFKPVKVHKELLENLIRKFRFQLEIRTIKNSLKKVYKLNERFKPRIFPRARNRKEYLKHKAYNREKYYKFFMNKNLRYQLYLEAVKENIRIYLDTKVKPVFAFRTDIGQPKRKFRRFKDYSIRLRNRHLLRRFASSTITIKQLRNYISKSRRSNFFSLVFSRFVELRLDTIVYRLNISKNAGEIRQLINHGNFLCNGKEVVFSNYQFNLYDIFTVKNKSKFYYHILNRINRTDFFYGVPRFMEVNFRIMCALIYRNPLPKHIYLPTNIQPLQLAGVGTKFRKK